MGVLCVTSLQIIIKISRKSEFDLLYNVLLINSTQLSVKYYSNSYFLELLVHNNHNYHVLFIPVVRS
jgi:hypothetical protein